ncbi:MAG: hypothetical protein Wins2KO_04190 [Winogradskyella sp.]
MKKILLIIILGYLCLKNRKSTKQTEPRVQNSDPYGTLVDVSMQPKPNKLENHVRVS